MEVSSHGIHQKRIEGLEFSGGIFTNLSHDHLDYHETFKAYRDVKKSFFDQLPKSAFALSNADDKNGKVMLQNTVAKKTYYALKSIADFKGQILENQFSGMLLKVNHQEVWSRLIGTFNAYNILAVYAASQLLNCNPLEVLQVLSVLRPVDGRFEYIVSNDNITAVIDYAHTPDALKNVLTTINQLRTGNETLITVVGCGGNRDAQKRPIMANIAATLSNKVILTSDNPRNEDPQKIINEMEAGINPVDFKKSVSILDRKQAIKTACQFASENDIILIAGKGHETYQEIEGVRHDFDDMEIVTQLLKRT
jgi:UDP-N-acetylmuramoyl-L-alanyl-D-glutamate--2,6-diaminopimelate ligase